MNKNYIHIHKHKALQLHVHVKRANKFSLSLNTFFSHTRYDHINVEIICPYIRYDHINVELTRLSNRHRAIDMI